MSWNERLYADTELSHRARAVYLYLRDHADAEGKCWPGIKRIASDLRLSRRTVQRALADLESAGYVERAERYRGNGGRSSNLYTVK